MKRKGNTSDFTSERNAELRTAFFSRNHYSTSYESLQKTIKTPTSRFWVDPYRARDMMSRMEKDPGCTARMFPERRRMYAALFEKYSEIRQRNPSRTRIEAVTMAIYSGAPEFYLSVPTARRILYTNT